MALAGELTKYIGNELVKAGGKSALSSLVPKTASKLGTGLATQATLSNIIPKAASKIAPDGMMTLYRGLTQKYDPNFPIAKLDTSGYESWTDNLDLAKQYGDYVYSIDVPKSDIKTSYLDENPNSITYGDRNPIYSIDKKAGLNGVSGNEYLLEVGSDYQKGLKYNPVVPDDEMGRAIQVSGVKNDVVKRAEGYLGNRMLDKTGKPITFYHSTPNEFDRFDDAMLGSNTGYDNTKLGHFVTTDKDFSKRFIDIDNVGKTGRTMELQANIQKPITHPYMAGYKYMKPEELDKIVEDYLIATDNQEFLDQLREWAEENGDSLYDEYMDMTIADSPFEVADSDREALMKNGYDAVEIVEGNKSGLVEGSKDDTPVSSYAVLNGDNLRPVRHIPIQQDNYESLYHQTSAKSLDDFSLDKRNAGVSDATMPEGIFLKETDADIGLPGKNQLQLDAKLNNPLRVINREDLKSKLVKLNPKVARYLRAEGDIDRLYEQMSEEAQNAVDKAYEKMYYDKSEANKKAFADATKKMTGIIPEWRSKIRDNAALSQKEIKDTLKKAGYDGLIMDEDRGSFGRKVKSYVVLDKEQLRDNSVPVKVKKYLPKLSSMSDDDARLLEQNYNSNKAHKLNGEDTTADELLARNIAKKNGVSKTTMDKLKKYADLSDDATYKSAKSELNKFLSRNNKEVDALDKMSRELLRSMGAEFENDMPVVYRATTVNETGSLSYTTQKKIAEDLVKNDDAYKKVIRYVVKPKDIVIAPQFLGPIDTGADLSHIIVKRA